jgi:pimeloyl-ACP methyl ester carboxylesterase
MKPLCKVFMMMVLACRPIGATVPLSAAQSGSAIVSSKSVRIEAGDITIAADLLQPTASAVLRPGVVVIHGSGGSDRRNAWAAGFAHGLAARGFAVVLPDKRGSGETDGDWRTADFETLAADAIAAVRWLQRQPGVDHRRVGVLGLSQGGHIAPLAAVRASSDIAFVITVSSSTVPMFDQMIDEVEKAHERANVPQDVAAAVTALHHAAAAVMFEGAPFDEYLRQRTVLAAGPHAPLVASMPDDPGHWLWRWARLVGRYDPLVYWSRLQVPALVAYGARDTQIRVARSVARLEPLLTGAVARSIDISIYGDTGHPLYEPDRAEIRREFLDHAASWVRAHTVAPAVK